MGLVLDWLQRAVGAGRQGNTGYMVTLESSSNPDAWIQLTCDSVNAAYPYDGEPVAELKRRGLAVPAGVELVAWEAGRFATFAHGGEPLAEIASFVERYARDVLGVEPTAGALTVTTDS